MATIAVGAILASSSLQFVALEEEPSKEHQKSQEFTRDEVSKHNGKTEDGSIWVTYREGVYDVTNFVASHPGGSRILLAGR